MPSKRDQVKLLSNARKNGQIRETLHDDPSHGVYTKTTCDGHEKVAFEVPPMAASGFRSQENVPSISSVDFQKSQELEEEESRQRSRVRTFSYC
jgi:hypothetical protein